MFYSRKLKRFKKINHSFFSRKKGFSKGIYSSLNCGYGSKDNKRNISKNLAYISKKIGINPKKLIIMKQTHSNKVILINKKNKNFKQFKSDAIITKIKGLALGVLTADCVPIILYDFKNEIIGCIHAGWKGAFSGIIENTLDAFKSLEKRNMIYASIGPCIGRDSYEVGKEFYTKFISEKTTNFMSLSKKNKKYFTKKNNFKKNFDLRKYVGDKLIKQNVKVDHVKLDTFIEKNNFFSYRRSQKLCESDYGRCISVISLI